MNGSAPPQMGPGVGKVAKGGAGTKSRGGDLGVLDANAPVIEGLEAQVILRVPEHLAVELYASLGGDGVQDGTWAFSPQQPQQLQPLPSISFELLDQQSGACKFVFNRKEYRAKLVNLPCFIESYKTFDGNGFHKTADIAQMLIVEGGDTPSAALVRTVLHLIHANAGDSGNQPDCPHTLTLNLKCAAKKLCLTRGNRLEISRAYRFLVRLF